MTLLSRRTALVGLAVAFSACAAFKAERPPIEILADAKVPPTAQRSDVSIPVAQGENPVQVIDRLIGKLKASGVAQVAGLRVVRDRSHDGVRLRCVEELELVPAPAPVCPTVQLGESQMTVQHRAGMTDVVGGYTRHASMASCAPTGPRWALKMRDATCTTDPDPAETDARVTVETTLLRPAGGVVSAR